MARAAKVCPHCPNLEPCPVHARRPWAGSTRRTRTVSGGRQQKRSRYVLYRDNHTCCLCGQLATEADHIEPLAEGGEDGVHNMQAICVSCHRQKTSLEALRGRAA